MFNLQRADNPIFLRDSGEQHETHKKHFRSGLDDGAF
jgi:hypothetical protein